MAIESWQRGAVRGRRPGPGDLGAYRALMDDPEVARWLWWRSTDAATVGAWHEADLRHWEEHGWGAWLLELDGSGLVGRGGIRRGELEGEPIVEMVWAVLSAHQGHGAASAAASEALRAAEELGIPGVVALIETANAASCAVAERAGMRLERELPYDGEPHRLYRADP